MTRSNAASIWALGDLAEAATHTGRVAEAREIAAAFQPGEACPGKAGQRPLSLSQDRQALATSPEPESIVSECPRSLNSSSSVTCGE